MTGTGLSFVDTGNFPECLLPPTLQSSGLVRQRPQMRLRQGSYAGRIPEVTGGSWRTHTRRTIRSSGDVIDSLKAAPWCTARTSSFAEAVLLAANLGEDSDTVAAITGQLAGALYSREGIPAHWLATFVWSHQIETMALELTTSAGWYPW